MNAQQISWLPEEVRNHIAQLERDLARVTAERDNARAQALADRAFQSDNAALRARVADLQQQLDNLTA